MNDTVLLLTGISVFGLMLIAIVLTVLEFQQMKDRNAQNSSKARRPNGMNSDSRD